MNWLKFTLFLAITSFLACTKPPDYPLEPVITFKSLSKSTLPQGNLNSDSLTIIFSYTDGDGDLGNDENQASVFLKDMRTGFESPSFSIPFVPEQGAGNGISGEIAIQVFTSCCIHPILNQICMPFGDADQYSGNLFFPIDTLAYEIYIVDRAGNESNVIKTDPIFLQCD